MTSPRLPARIDRATFERVLQRAAELQAATRDIGEGLTEEEVLALGAEVGIPQTELRQALLEERTRHVAPAPEGMMDRWLAPAELAAQRVVQGSETEVAEALTRWLDRHEHLHVQRAIPGRITFEPINSLAGAMRKIGAMFDSGRGKPYLEKAELLTALINPLEPGFCHVTLAASLRSSRTGWLVGGAGLATAATTAGAVTVLLGAPEVMLLVAAVPGAGLGWAVARGYRKVAERAQLGLERALDALERRPGVGERKPLPEPKSHAIAREVGSVVRGITTEVRKALEEK